MKFIVSLISPSGLSENRGSSMNTVPYTVPAGATACGNVVFVNVNAPDSTEAGGGASVAVTSSPEMAIVHRVPLPFGGVEKVSWSLKTNVSADSGPPAKRVAAIKCQIVSVTFLLL